MGTFFRSPNIPIKSWNFLEKNFHRKISLATLLGFFPKFTRKVIWLRVAGCTRKQSESGVDVDAAKEAIQLWGETGVAASTLNGIGCV